MNIDLVKENCTGCKVCEAVCPKSAIRMKESEDGFLYPFIDKEKCIDCGICAAKCNALNAQNVQSLQKAYYGWSADKDIVKKSSSGGLFSCIAETILAEGGVVFGADFDSESKKVLLKSTDEVSLEALRRSKYVEADTNGVFQKVKAELSKGRKVLFTGTPCHVAALKNFLKKEYDNLLTCDFICGGAPSSKFFEEHLRHLEKKYKSKVKDVNFRPKVFGWKEYAIKIDFENGKSYVNYGYLDTYVRGFLFEHAFVRENCATCKYRNNHHSDIILADFWGYRQVSGIKDDDTGMSLVVSNSDKGTEVMEKLIKTKTVEMTKIPLEYASYNFGDFDKSKKYAAAKKAFMAEYKKSGFEAAAKKVYMKNCARFKVKKSLKKIIGLVGINK